MLRVALITREYPPRVVGDIAEHVKKIALNLVDDGLETYVVTYHDSLRVLTSREDGVSVYRVGNPVEPHFNILTWNLAFAIELERVVSDIHYSGNIKLIDAHEWQSIVPSVLLKKAHNIPFIYSIYSLEDHRSHYADAPLNTAIKNVERLGMHEANKILVKSEWMKSEIKKIHAIADEKVVSISPTSTNWTSEIRTIYRSLVQQ